jgi:DNA repair protein RadC
MDVLLRYRSAEGEMMNSVKGIEVQSEALHLAEARKVVTHYLEKQLQKSSLFEQAPVVKEYVITKYAGIEREVFSVAYLDVHLHLIAWDDVFLGTVNQTAVYPREIAREALRYNASSVILAHNHPSGRAEPSHADELVTRSIKEALKLIDVRVIDHLVVSGKSVVSLLERGLL